MSASVRAAIAAAVATVPGLSCTPYFRQTTKPGDAMVRLEAMTRSANGFDFVLTWQVLLVLPSDIVAAEKYLDAHAPALLEALATQMVVGGLILRELILTDGARLPVAVVEGKRED